MEIERATINLSVQEAIRAVVEGNMTIQSAIELAVDWMINRMTKVDRSDAATRIDFN